ncbi:MAG TPA: glycosyltransferase [Gaiellaceae bacterium]|jgi:GT2 family glycosyltransferase/SAM-dependent methyltransferase
MKLEDLVVHGESGVLVPSHEGTAATYLDGAEQYLLDALKSAGDVSVHSSELRARVRDWASLYHLTPYRATIFDALGLSPDARVLELGAGCGAVTRWLGEHFAQVDAVEGSLARARVARERCRDLEGVRVAAANFFDLDFGGSYDIATLIGVLEYSHLYHPEHGDNPSAAALSNLELARRSLADDGMLVIAIENKLGLKYLSGRHEDHAARRFEGIEGYPSRSSAVTWSAVELEQLVLDAGYSAVDFYLPFPDYKLARTVFDAKAANPGTYPANWVETPFPDRAGAQADAPFDESLALREVVAGGLLRDLSNSFLVLAYNGDRNAVRARLGVEDGWTARHYSLDRRPAFCKRTSLEIAGDGLIVRNIAAVPGAQAPEPGLALTQRLEDEPFRPGHQLQFTILEHAAAGRLNSALPALLAQLHDFLVQEFGAGRSDSAGLTLLTGNAIDVTPWNIVVDAESGEWHSIDGEWTFEGVLPVDYVLWRGLHHAAARYGRMLAGSGASGSATFALAAVNRLLPAASSERLSLYEEIETFIQRAAGADPGARTAEITPRMRELVGAPVPEPGPPTGITVVAHAEALIASPELVTAFAAAFDGTKATLVAYAPDSDPAEIAPRLEAVLDQKEGELDVVLLAIPREGSTEEQLAGSAHAYLGEVQARGAFAALPRFASSDAAALRALAFPLKPGPELPPEGTGPAPCVSIVIPVFNRLELTKQCLETMRAATLDSVDEPTYEVIVVDNGSTDGTAGYLRAEQAAGRLRCVINPENAGFGGACNQGAEVSRGEFVLLLNNDTIPQPGWLAALVEAMADTTVGIAGSRLLYPDGTIQHAGIVWNAAGELDHVHRGVPADDPAVLVPHDFAAVTGACLIIRRDVFFEIGAFDSAYHMYVEDVDLCIRTWDAGLRVTYCPSSVVVHLENASMTDVAWRDQNVRAGWQKLNARWGGRWPNAVRRFAWPHALAGSPKHLAVLAFADDLIAHPDLAAEWGRVFGGSADAKLVIYGPGWEPAPLAERLEALFDPVGSGEPGLLDVLVLADPHGTAPASNLVAAIGAVLASSPPSGHLGVLPWVDETGIARLRDTTAGVALVG